MLVAGRTVSLQITVLKVLAGHPEGRACVADLTRCVGILMSTGSDWINRTKGLAARAPELDIFGSAYVLRDDLGWQITDIGCQFLDSLEATSPAPRQDQQPEINAATAGPIIALNIVQPVLRLVVDNMRTSLTERAPNQTRRTA
jgi:hypothetical protein